MDTAGTLAGRLPERKGVRTPELVGVATAALTAADEVTGRTKPARSAHDVKSSPVLQQLPATGAQYSPESQYPLSAQHV
jgi:hypothetical protein